MELIELRANRAKAEEDYRIARKHRDEAGARQMTAANSDAYLGACRWADQCRERMEAARGAVIRYLADDAARLLDSYKRHEGTVRTVRAS